MSDTDMNEFSAQVFALINADKPEHKPVSLKTISVREPTLFEEKESRLLDFRIGVDHTMLVDLQDSLNAMQTKVQCRKLLAATGYTQAGWPALALFDHMLVTFGTGKHFTQPSGWANVPPEEGHGLVPCLFVNNAALWASYYLSACRGGDVEAAAKCLCKLAYIMTVIFMGCPQPRLREKDQPSADQLA